MFRISYLIVFITFIISNLNYAFASNCTFGGVDFDNLNSKQQSVLKKYGAICSSPSSQNFKYKTGIDYTNLVMEVALLVEKKFVLTVLSKENYVIGQKQLPLRHEEQLPFHIVEIFQDF